MKLADISHGPAWIIWVVFAIFAILSAVLISGSGSWLISGYNTASKKEKAKYDEKSYAEQLELEWQLLLFSFLLQVCLKRCYLPVLHMF